MILLIHNNKQVVEVSDLDDNKSIVISHLNPIEALFSLAEEYTDSILVWCHIEQKDNLNLKGLIDSFHLKNMMMSYSTQQYLPSQIGYVEDSPFLKVSKTVKYPTWLMSSQVGAIHASQLLKFKGVISTKNNFDYVLNSIAKLGIVKGLFCYSEPRLLKTPHQSTGDPKISIKTLFKFVKQHYRPRWIVLLLINFIWHDKRIPFLSTINTLFYSRIVLTHHFEINTLRPSQKTRDSSIDVIIPTMGRKQYLHDVLKDLSVQTHLPKKVIIVEQNPNQKSTTELDFIENESWPFKVVHKFIHQTGACNARNLALKEVDAEYVYLADDDNKFDKNLLSKIMYTIQLYNLEAITMSYLKIDEVERFKNAIQWSTFGAGSSVIKSKYLDKITFNMALEFGYGEDVDFGIQLRNSGADVIYFPTIEILHLNAPIGGFRTKFVHPWEEDEVQPKPSPTVLLNRITNTSKHQVLGFKTILFFKFYKVQSSKNPISYYKKFKKQWKQSVYWANKLKEDNS